MNLKYLKVIALLFFNMVSFTQTISDLKLQLEKLNLTGITITEIQNITAGDYTIPGGKTIKNLPAFTRVALVSKPSPESNIRIEVWMPINGWNQRLLGTGNGGGAGSISYGALASGLMRGFATTNTDMGTSPNIYDAAEYPEKWKDFGYRATHEMTVAAKIIVNVYYKKPADYFYFIGCSTGGQQALMEAQRYPEDYNGIVVGAPANNRTHLHASFIWNLQANYSDTGEIVTSKKMEFLSNIILNQYKGHDGGAPDDNFISDPRVCYFNPDLLPRCCNYAKTDSCFTDEELEVLKKIYNGPMNPKNGERIYSPLPLGGTRLENVKPHLYPFFWVFGRNFDYLKFDFDRDMTKVDSILAPILNANDPNLNQMKKNGGKIIMYSGTNDQLVIFQDALHYYDRVIEVQKGLNETQSFFRFFLVPGMGHCGGGPGLTDFGQSLSQKVPLKSEYDILTAIINWVENGIAPDKIIASSFHCCDNADSISIQRPLYPYPIFPEYKGGQSNSPFSFQGEKHPEGGVLKPATIYLK